MEHSTTLWLGSQGTFDAAIAAYAKGDAMAQAQNMAASSESAYLADRTYERLVSIQQGVAMINIDGTLVPGSAGWSIFFGNVGYDDIREAIIRAVQDTSVISVLLNINSGGGAVGGVMDGGNAISQVASIKPVVAYTGSAMCSAALWLGSTANYLMAAETAMVGSVGIVQVHMERSKMLEEAGIKVTVVRAGAKKMLANSYEPLTDEAKAELQDQADHLYDVFIGHMAKQYGITVNTAEKKFGQGRVFMGSQGVDVGLLDKVGSFDDAFSKAQALGKARLGSGKGAGVPKKTGVQGAGANMGENPGHNASITQGTAMPTPFTDEQLALQAAGVELPVDEQDNAAGAEQAATADDKPAATTTTPAQAATPAPAQAAAQDGVAALAALLATAQADLAAARLENANLKAAQQTNAEQHNALLAIARNSVRVMGMHFNVSSEAVANMDTAEVLAKHASLTESFKAKFPAGRTAAAATEGGKAPSKASGLGDRFRSLVQAQQGSK